MPAPRISKDEAKRRIDLIEKALRQGHPPPGVNPGKKLGAVGAAVRACGISSGSAGAWFAAAVSAYRQPKWELWKEPDPNSADVDPIKRRSIQDELAKERKRVAALERELSALRDIRSELFGLDAPTLAPPSWQITVDAKRNHPEVPVLFTSDFQVGEVIREREVSGWNAYSPAIFKRRYKRLIEATIALCEREDPSWRYPGIVYLRGGDSISGSIHIDLEATQDLVPTEQVRMVAEQEIAGIEALAKRFKQVAVWSVPGNHDRTTPKPRSKRSVDLSFDDLVIWHIEQHFAAKGARNISFRAPRSGDAFFKVYNTSFLMTHGDAIGSRGGAGFVGPAATISRGIQRVRQQYGHVGQKIDWVLVGHFHVPMILENGISNGNLAGFSEYANREMRARPEPPSQWLFWVHPKWGITTHRLVKLEDPIVHRNSNWVTAEAV